VRCGWCWSTEATTPRRGQRLVDRGEDELHGRDAARRGPAGRGEDRERIKALEREVRELRHSHEILRQASAYFAQAELDRRSKP
jgi:transposase-like protein